MVEPFLADVIRPGAGRGLDFITLDELRKRTGVNACAVPKWVVSEMLSNSLDTDATTIQVEAKTEGPYDVYSVSDNGSKKITPTDLELILDFSNKASSKRGFKCVSRGYLGNALKCIFGYSYALNEAKGNPQPVIEVTSHDAQYFTTLKPNPVTEQITHQINIKKTEANASINRFRVKYPIDRTYSQNSVPSTPFIETILLKNMIKAAAMVNPTRRITYDLWGEKEELGLPNKTEALRQETSILWYTDKQFTELFFDYVRATPSTQIKEFISLFRGFTSKKKQGEILQMTSKRRNHESQTEPDTQFLPSTQIQLFSKDHVTALFNAMRGMAKPVSRRSVDKVLGCVGEDRFKQITGAYNLKYVLFKGRIQSTEPNAPTYPYLIELAVFDREADEEGLQVYQCVNFMATNENLIGRSFNVQHRLGLARVDGSTNKTIILHLVSPVLEWLNYGKTGLHSENYMDTIKKAFDKLIPIPKPSGTKLIKKPMKPVSWVPKGRIGTKTYEARLRDFANEINRINSQRTIYTGKLSSRGWAYVLEGLSRVTKNDLNQAQRAINDCRKLGYLPIDFTANDQDSTRRFTGLHEAISPVESLTDIKQQTESMLRELPKYSTNYWDGEKYYVMMCVEKGDIKNLFEPICREYHVPIVSSKGWSPILLRAQMAELCKDAESKGLQPVLLLFYDHDPAGIKITNTFKKNLRDIQQGTKYNPENLIIHRFGLNSQDIDGFGLMWIENLETSSGNVSKDKGYIEKYGYRKCESNALFRNDETIRAGLGICRQAIEKYYGSDALHRFREKERWTRQTLSGIYEDPIWNQFNEKISEIIESYQPNKNQTITIEEPEPILHVKINDLYYGMCPKCGNSFNDEELVPNQIVRCRHCNAQIQIQEERM